MKLPYTFIAILLALSTAFLMAQGPPTTMLKIVTQLQSTDVPQDSFGAKPKVMYRAGTAFCRIEEEADLANGIHGLMIVNEPDAWMVNLANNTARHVVDQGPTHNCHLPVFANRIPDLPVEDAKAMASLEFGTEKEFFMAHGANPEKGPTLQGQQTTAYKLKFGESSLGLFTYGVPERPLAVAWNRGPKSDIFWFSGYGAVPFDRKLFEKPKGVTIEEIKQ